MYIDIVLNWKVTKKQKNIIYFVTIEMTFLLLYKMEQTSIREIQTVRNDKMYVCKCSR